MQAGITLFPIANVNYAYEIVIDLVYPDNNICVAVKATEYDALLK